eukprot:gnl/TRDRNA2_/TRDRNA2_174989_c4_seq6.p1 gnl/TRDRNA2_/TRDRNA2_174989_c4~~gnl/TRDRNA2_/TRDRNA2_174989_c4_seq6.p1  ORF type:complete len:993 (-),score=284.64 gnl/TRDRNA2_/TRDRNA2_174989_c4_seq6:136-3114(-)
MDADELCGTLKRKRIQIPGRKSIHEVPRTVSQLKQSLSSLIKALYKRLFERTVASINDSFKELTLTQDTPEEECNHIGILDIYGFERLEKNSFEQLCINLANERLQQYFVENVLEAEQSVYKREGLPWVGLALPDSQPVVKAIDQVFTTLDSCSQQLVKGIGNVTDEKFCEQAVDLASKDPIQKTVMFKLKLGNKRRSVAGGASMSQKDGFVIKHYAGEVEYTTKGWPDKNNDKLLAECEELICESSAPLIKSFGEEEAPATTKNVNFRSISKKYTTDLELLLKTLGSCALYYIRCFKPNDKHKPNLFNQRLVLDQVIQCGTIELVKIMHDGYPNRCMFEEITSRFQSLLPESFQRYGMRTFIEALMLAYEVPQKEWALGMSRLFLKAGQLRMLEDMRAEGATANADKLAAIVSSIVRKRWSRAGQAIRLCLWLPKFLQQIYAEKAKKRLSVASLGVARIGARLDAAKKRVAERKLRARRRLVGAFQAVRFNLAAMRCIKELRRRRLQKAFSMYARIYKAVMPLASRARERIREAELERQRIAEEERLRKEAEAESERVRQAEEARRAAEAEAQRLRLEAEAAAEAEKKRREEEAKAEAERLRVQEEERQEAEKRRLEEEAKAAEAARLKAEEDLKREEELRKKEEEIEMLRAKAAELERLKAGELSPARAKGIPTPTRSPTKMRPSVAPSASTERTGTVLDNDEVESDIGDSASRVMLGATPVTKEAMESIVREQMKKEMEEHKEAIRRQQEEAQKMMQALLKKNEELEGQSQQQKSQIAELQEKIQNPSETPSKLNQSVNSIQDSRPRNGTPPSTPTQSAHKTKGPRPSASASKSEDRFSLLSLGSDNKSGRSGKAMSEADMKNTKGEREWWAMQRRHLLEDLYGEDCQNPIQQSRAKTRASIGGDMSAVMNAALPHESGRSSRRLSCPQAVEAKKDLKGRFDQASETIPEGSSSAETSPTSPPAESMDAARSQPTKLKEPQAVKKNWHK